MSQIHEFLVRHSPPPPFFSLLPVKFIDIICLDLYRLYLFQFSYFVYEEECEMSVNKYDTFVKIIPSALRAVTINIFKKDIS